MPRFWLRLTIAAILMTLWLGATPMGAAAQVSGQSTDQTTSTIAATTEAERPSPTPPSMLTLPNSGVAPKSSTDRGGWAQYAVLGGIVLALGTITFFISRESRAAKRRHAQVADGAAAQPPVDP